MVIKIERYCKKAEAIDGYLYIENMFICDCAENALSAIKAGHYHVTIAKCRQLHRKMPVVVAHKDLLLNCMHCKKKSCVNINAKMPVMCPMLSPGNGVYHRDDSSIKVGEFIVSGCLKHTREKFDIIYDRIRKNIERGKEVTLIIVDNYKVKIAD